MGHQKVNILIHSSLQQWWARRGDPFSFCVQLWRLEPVIHSNISTRQWWVGDVLSSQRAPFSKSAMTMRSRKATFSMSATTTPCRRASLFQVRYKSELGGVTLLVHLNESELEDESELGCIVLLIHLAESKLECKSKLRGVVLPINLMNPNWEASCPKSSWQIWIGRWILIGRHHALNSSSWIQIGTRHAPNSSSWIRIGEGIWIERHRAPNSCWRIRIARCRTPNSS